MQKDIKRHSPASAETYPTPNTIPAPASQENTGSTDLLDDAVAEIMDNVQEGLGLADDQVDDEF